MKMNKTVKITIDGKEYTLKYNIGSLIKLEEMVTTKNITKLVQSFPFSHTDTVACLYVGLLEEHPSITPKKAMQLVENWLENDTLINLCNLILTALARAGAVGNTSEFSKETEADEEEGK